jgi:hypothetical protein
MQVKLQRLGRSEDELAADFRAWWQAKQQETPA